MTRNYPSSTSSLHYSPDPSVTSNPLWRLREAPQPRLFRQERRQPAPQIALANLPRHKSWQTNPVPSERFHRIQERAYFKALKRGFLPGRELDDWLAAEYEIDAGE